MPYVVEQDEDGVWCASAQLCPGEAAFGDGPTREEAVADLRTGLELLISCSRSLAWVLVRPRTVRRFRLPSGLVPSETVAM